MAEKQDILVIGGGIAGLTAGLHAARAGKTTRILIGAALGGNLLSIEKIEGLSDYPDGVAGFELCPTIQMGAAEAGATFSMVEADNITREGDLWRVRTAEGDIEAGAVILASGTSFRRLGVPGEDRLFGRGVSQCASCDAPLLRDKRVVVVGGGDSAMQEALTLIGIVSHITILTDGETLTAQQSFIDRVTGNGSVEVKTGVTVEEILGETVVEGVRYWDESGAADIEVEGVFVFVGMTPNAAYLDGLIVFDPQGKIPVDEAMATGLPGLFAAGTLRASAACRATASAEDGGSPPSPQSVISAARDTNREVFMADRITVHDPRGYPPKVTGKRLAPRAQSLDGKVVYLVDCLFDNSDVFMDEMRDWFAEHMPGVETPVIKPRESWVDDPDMRAVVAEKGDAAILGVGL